MNALPFRESATDAIRYWERGRFFYNAILLAVVGVAFWFFWPGSRQALIMDQALTLFVLAVLANVAYCAAYPVDLFAQSSEFRPVWLRLRPAVLIVGTAFASVIAQYISRGLFSAAD